jgi:hypothetical protein
MQITNYIENNLYMNRSGSDLLVASVSVGNGIIIEINFRMIKLY